jgi:glycosyltransferase involved in cell wall biosynthesis
MNPKISVIMPAYNAGKYIKDAIDSVVNQSFKDWELLVVNDASKDNTLEIIKSFTDPRIKLTNNEINLGSILSRNLAASVQRRQIY